MVSAARLMQAALLAVMTMGCSGQQKGSANHIGETRLDATPPPTDSSGEHHQADEEPPPEDVIVQHAAAISGYRNVDGRSFSRESLFTHVADADVICIGERHDDPTDHYAQLALVSALLERRDIRGFQLGLGMEMVRRYNQPVLSDFVDGQISEDELEELTAWSQDWGFPIQYYRPQMREILVQGGELLALGVPQDITRKVAADGLEGLDENDRRTLPELDTEDALHRELFDLLMKAHPDISQADLDRYYLAQVIWDESMAERAASWIKQQLPGRKLVVFAGAAHCHPHAIPARIERRGQVRVVSILPAAKSERPAAPETESAAQGAEAPLLPEGIEPREALVLGYDYLLLLDRE